MSPKRRCFAPFQDALSGCLRPGGPIGELVDPSSHCLERLTDAIVGSGPVHRTDQKATPWDEDTSRLLEHGRRAFHRMDYPDCRCLGNGTAPKWQLTEVATDHPSAHPCPSLDQHLR